MSLKGMIASLDVRHPQELVDALYAEFFDLHPEDSMVDVGLAIRKNDEAKTIEVVDARLFRVSNPVFDEGEHNASPHRYIIPEAADGGPVEVQKAMVRWANSLNLGLMWVHKMPEGYVMLSSASTSWNQNLGTIDFALGDHQHRTYQLGSLVNRKVSLPLPPPDMPMPETGDIEIDMAVLEYIVMTPARNQDLDPSHPFFAIAREHLAAQRLVRETEEQHGEPEHMKAHETINETALAMAKIIIAERLLPKVDPALSAELIETVRRVDEVRGLDQPQPLGFQPPKDRSILSLPEVYNYASDNTRKDRLN